MIDFISKNFGFIYLNSDLFVSLLLFDQINKVDNIL